MAYKIKKKKYKVGYYVGDKKYYEEIEARTKNQADKEMMEKNPNAYIVGIVQK